MVMGRREKRDAKMLVRSKAGLAAAVLSTVLLSAPGSSAEGAAAARGPDL